MKKKWLKGFLFLAVLIISASAVLAKAQIQVSPLKVNVGSKITINATPNAGSIYPYVYIYRGNSYKTSIPSTCPSFLCFNPVSLSFTIPTSWINDTYNVRILDFPNYNWQIIYFNVTGSSAVQKNGALSLSPNLVNAGNALIINVSPGNDGSSNYAYIYKDNIYKTYFRLNPCSAIPCYNNLLGSFTIPSNWANGTYAVKVYDYAQYNYIQSSFVVGSQTPAFNYGLSVNPGANSVIAGAAVSSIISVALLNSSPQIINLSLSGCPPQSNCSLSKAGGLPPYNSTLSIATSPTTPAIIVP